MSTCKGCGAEIKWNRTAAGKWQPLNADGSSHHGTCPNVEEFRRPLEALPFPFAPGRRIHIEGRDQVLACGYSYAIEAGGYRLEVGKDGAERSPTEDLEEIEVWRHRDGVWRTEELEAVELVEPQAEPVAPARQEQLELFG